MSQSHTNSVVSANIPVCSHPKTHYTMADLLSPNTRLDQPVLIDNSPEPVAIHNNASVSIPNSWLSSQQVVSDVGELSREHNEAPDVPAACEVSAPSTQQIEAGQHVETDQQPLHPNLSPAGTSELPLVFYQQMLLAVKTS
ncbi:hypothetical protein CsatA_016178 [Cannabis sativa]